jgi:hypothetical protein
MGKFAKKLSLKMFGNAVEEPVLPGVGDRAKGRERLWNQVIPKGV